MKKSMIIVCLMLISILMYAQDGLNIGGELKLRNRINLEPEGTKPGFEFYELEFFIDGDVSDYASFYIEYTLMHKTKPEAENVWMDLHAPMRPAFAHGGMGLRLGNFHVPFGFENDDNEGYMYQGRASVNHSLVHGMSDIDGWKMRQRQIGIVGTYSVGPLTAWAGMFNGNGGWNNYGGSDNNMWDYDFSLKTEVQAANIAFGASHWMAPGTDTTDENFKPDTGVYHSRDITRTGVHFKYPASSLFVSEDAALGGEKFLIFGEYIMGSHKENDWDQIGDIDMSGYFVEAQLGVIPQTLVAFVRYDAYDPNTDADDTEYMAITPGINWFFWNSMRFIAEYDHIAKTGDDDSTSLQDRVALEISLTF
jgi:hypothetical protein